MKRWWLIRHIRYVYYRWRVAQHYDMWRELGYLPVNAQYDINVLNKIWRGEL